MKRVGITIAEYVAAGVPRRSARLMRSNAITLVGYYGSGRLGRKDGFAHMERLATKLEAIDAKGGTS